MIDRAYKILRILALIGALFFMGARLAHASNFFFETKAQAFQACGGPYPNPQSATYNCALFADSYAGGYTGDYILQNSNYSGGFGIFYFKTAPTCPSGQIDENGTCITDPNAASVAACELLRDQTTGAGNDSVITRRGPATSCINGCTFGPLSGAGTVQTGSGADLITTADYAFSGTTCTATVDSPMPTPAIAPAAIVKPTASECFPASGGMTFCTKQDGKQCYSASSGKQICWTPGETGTKTDANVAQVRAPGTATPAAPTPPPGETLTLTAGPQTTTTTTTSPTGAVTTTTTTQVNYTTTNGTNAGTVQAGETAPGTTSGTTSSATVGNCATPVICSGNAIDCALLAETHLSRCAAESNTPGKTLTSGEQTTLTGEGAAASVDGTAAGLVTETEIGASGLDSSGFLSNRSCPVIPSAVVMGQTIDFDISVVCNWLAIGGALVLLFGSIAALKILGAF